VKKTEERAKRLRDELDHNQNQHLFELVNKR